MFVLERELMVHGSAEMSLLLNNNQPGDNWFRSKSELKILVADSWELSYSLDWWFVKFMRKVQGGNGESFGVTSDIPTLHNVWWLKDLFSINMNEPKMDIFDSLP